MFKTSYQGLDVSEIPALSKDKDIKAPQRDTITRKSQNTNKLVFRFLEKYTKAIDYLFFFENGLRSVLPRRTTSLSQARRREHQTFLPSFREEKETASLDGERNYGWDGTGRHGYFDVC